MANNNDTLTSLENIGKSATQSVSKDSNDLATVENALNSNQPQNTSITPPPNNVSQKRIDAFNKALQLGNEVKADKAFNEMKMDDFINQFGKEAYMSRSRQAQALMQNAGLNFNNPLRDYVTDPLVGIGQGIVGGALGTVGVAGLLDPTGTINSAIGSANESVNNFAESLKTRNMQSAKAFSQANAQKDYLENEYKEQAEVANGADSSVAAFNRIMRDFSSYLKNSDMTTLKDDLAQGLGFVYPASLTARALSTGGKLAGKAIGGSSRAAEIGESIGGSSMLNSALGYGGASANNIANELSQIPTEELIQSSPQAQAIYQDYLQKNGGDIEDALARTKEDIVSNTSLKAGIYAGLIAAVPSAFMSQEYLKHPFTKATYKSLGYNIAENTAQGAVTVGENLAKQQNANPDQSLAEGAGANIGLGFTSSLSSSIGGVPRAEYARRMARREQQDAENLMNSKADESGNTMQDLSSVIQDTAKGKITEPSKETSNINSITNTTEQPVKQEQNIKTQESVQKAAEALKSKEVNDQFEEVNESDDIITGFNKLNKKALDRRQNQEKYSNDDILQSQLAPVMYANNMAKEFNKAVNKDNNLLNTDKGKQLQSATMAVLRDKNFINNLRAASVGVNNLSRNLDNFDNTSKTLRDSAEYLAKNRIDTVSPNVIKALLNSKSISDGSKRLIRENLSYTEHAKSISKLSEEKGITKEDKELLNTLSSVIQNNLINQSVFDNNPSLRLFNDVQFTTAIVGQNVLSALHGKSINSDEYFSTFNPIMASFVDGANKQSLVSGHSRKELPNLLKQLQLVSKLYKDTANKTSEISQEQRNFINNFSEIADSLIEKQSPENIQKLQDMLSVGMTEDNSSNFKFTNVSELSPDQKAEFANTGINPRVNTTTENTPSGSEEVTIPTEPVAETIKTKNNISTAPKKDKGPLPNAIDSSRIVSEPKKEIKKEEVTEPKVKSINKNKVQDTLKEELKQEVKEEIKPVETKQEEPKVESPKPVKKRHYALVSLNPVGTTKTVNVNTSKHKPVYVSVSPDEKLIFNSTEGSISDIENYLNDLKNNKIISDYKLTKDKDDTYAVEYTSDLLIDDARQVFIDALSNSNPFITMTENQYQKYIKDSTDKLNEFNKIISEGSRNTELVTDVTENSIDNVFNTTRDTGIADAYTNDNLGMDVYVTRDLASLGSFNSIKGAPEHPIHIPTPVANKLFGDSQEMGLIGHIQNSLKELLNNKKLFKNNTVDLINGVADNVPTYLQLFKQVEQTEDGKYQLADNNAYINRVSLSIADTLLKTASAMMSGNPVDIANNFNISVKDLMNSKKQVLPNGTLIGDGRAFIIDGSKGIPIQYFINSLNSSLKDLLGFEANNPNADIRDIENFFNGLACELLDCLSNDVVSINQYQLRDEIRDKDNNIITPALRVTMVEPSSDIKTIIEDIKATNESDETVDEFDDIYKSGYHDNIVSDLFNSEGSLLDQEVLIHKQGETPKIDGTKTDNLTKSSINFIKDREKVDFKVNPTMYRTINDGYNSLFLWRSLLGIPSPINIRDSRYRASVTSKDSDLEHAITTATTIVNQMQSYAENYNNTHDDKITLNDVVKNYSYRVLSNGRLQENEAYGPVVQKLVREIITPTEATVDLTNSNDMVLYQSAILQAFGTDLGTILTVDGKEYNTQKEAINALFDKALDNLDNIANNENHPLHDIYSRLKKFTDDSNIKLNETLNLKNTKDIDQTANDIKNLIRALNSDLGFKTPASMRALLSLIQYNSIKDNKESLKNFKCYDWIEVDGTNHGPSHTLAEYSIDYSEIPSRLARVGVFIGSNDLDNQTRAQANKAFSDKKDLYTEGQQYATRSLERRRNSTHTFSSDLNSSNKDRRTDLVNIIKFVSGEELEKVTAREKAEELNIIEKVGNEYRSVADNVTNSSTSVFKMFFDNKSEKAYLDFNGDSWSYNRSWMKPWIMQGGYMSGLNGLTNGAMRIASRNFSKMRNDILTSLEDIYGDWKEVTALFKNISQSNSISDTDRILLGKAIYRSLNHNLVNITNITNEQGLEAFNTFTNNINNFLSANLANMASSHTKNVKFIYGIKTEFDDNVALQLLVRGWDYFKTDKGTLVYSTLQNNIKTYLMTPIADANKELLTKQTNVITSKITSISAGSATAYNLATRYAITQASKNGTSLTIADINNLQKELKALDNTYTSENGLVNYTLGMQGNIPLTGNKVSDGRAKKSRNTKYAVDINNQDYISKYITSSGTTFELTDTFYGARNPNVSGVPVSTHVNSDVTVMSTALKEFSDLHHRPVESLSAHDGQHTSLKDVSEMSHFANKACSESFVKNPLKAFYQKHLDVVTAYKDENSILSEATKDLFNKINKAIKEKNTNSNIFNELGITKQDITDYLVTITQFLRPEANTNNDFSISYDNTLFEHLDDYFGDNERVKDVYKKLATKLRKNPENKNEVLGSFVDSLRNLVKNPQNIATEVIDKGNINEFPINVEFTYDDLLTLADDSLNNTSNMIDRVDALHQAMNELGIIYHHFSGNAQGFKKDIPVSEEVQTLLDRYGVVTSGSEYFSDKNLEKIGRVINERANQIIREKENKSKFYKDTVKPRVQKITSVSEFLNQLNKLKSSSDSSSISMFNLVRDICIHKIARGESLPKLIFTDSDTYQLEDNYEPETMEIYEHGKYIYDPIEKKAYIVINTKNIENAFGSDNLELEIQRAIAHETIHGTGGEAISSCLTKWRDRGSVTPPSRMTQEEYLVNNIIYGVYSLAKTVQNTIKRLPEENVQDFLLKNYGQHFGSFLYNLVSQNNESYSDIYELFNKFNDLEYSLKDFYKDILSSPDTEMFIDEMMAFASSNTEEVFNKIDKQINKAIQETKDSHLKNTLRKFAQNSYRTLLIISSHCKRLFKNIVNLVLYRGQIVPKDSTIKDAIKESFSTTFKANVSTLIMSRVAKGNTIDTVYTKNRGDSFINENGIVNTNFRYKDLPSIALNTSKEGLAQSLAGSWDTLLENAIYNAKVNIKEFNYYDERKTRPFSKISPKELMPSQHAEYGFKAQNMLKNYAQLKANNVVNKAKTLIHDAGFFTSLEQDNLFDKVFYTIYTQTLQNSQNYSRLSQLREYILSNISPKDLLDNKENPTQTDLDFANLKYDLLTGRRITAEEFKNTPNFEQALFYSLVTLDDKLGTLLSGMKVPDVYKTSKGDNILDKAVIAIVDNSSEYVTRALSTKKLRNNSTNLRDEVAALLTAYNNKTISEAVQLEQTNIIGNSVHAMNRKMQEGEAAIIDYTLRKAGITKDKFPEHSIYNALFSNNNIPLDKQTFGDKVGESVTSFFNKHVKSDLLNAFIKDLVGSTNETYAIYGHNKQAKAEVQQTRTLYRQNFPDAIIKSFKKKHKAPYYERITDCISGCDLASLYSLGFDNLKSVLSNSQILTNRIKEGESIIANSSSSTKYNAIIKDAKNLAHVLATESSKGKEYPHNFKRNAYAILVAHLGLKLANDSKLESVLDNLISFYALNEMKTNRAEDYKFMKDTLTTEPDGMKQILSILDVQYKKQLDSSKDMNIRLNAIKGFIGSDSQDTSHIVIDNNDALTKKELQRRGYTYLKDYGNNSGKGYYYSNLPERNMFAQGSYQDIHYCMNGINADGFSISTTAEHIYDPKQVNKLLNSEYNANKNSLLKERLIPIYTYDPKTDSLKIMRFERSVDTSIMEKAKPQKHIAKLVGIVAGRMHELSSATKLNNALTKKVVNMYKQAKDKSQYVNLFEYLPESKKRNVETFRNSKDAVITDALMTMPKDVLDSIDRVFQEDSDYLIQHIDEIFPNRDKKIPPENWLANHKVFMVRKDLINDIIGFRLPSITDAWTGVSRWKPQTQERIRKIAEIFFGNNAYKYIYNTELGLIKTVSFARNNIVIKSVSVGVDNLVANFYQLVLRGVPLSDIYRNALDVYSQLDLYTRDRNSLIQIEAKMAATDNPAVLEKLRIRQNIIQDRMDRLSIAPLIQAGEFSTIADVGLTDEEVLFTKGKFFEACNNALDNDHVPKALSVPIKYFLVTKDTALYRFLEKSVQYGDFIAKAIRYKHLIEKKGYDKDRAMMVISDEFVNYDRLGGRNRTYLENIGLLWFYNFKLRMVKVHLSMLKDDPARLLLNYMNPINLPTPMSDSALGKLFSGGLGYTVGPEMLFNFWRLNPWVQLFGWM